MLALFKFTRERSQHPLLGMSLSCWSRRFDARSLTRAKENRADVRQDRKYEMCIINEDDSCPEHSFCMSGEWGSRRGNQLYAASTLMP